MFEWERPNDSRLLNRSEMKETKMEKCSYFFQKIISGPCLNCFADFSSFHLFFSSFLLFFIFVPVCSYLPWASFDTPWQWLWSINHLFPELSVPACTEMKQQPLDHRHSRLQPFSAQFSCQSPHTQQSNPAQCFTDIPNHLVCFQAKYR